MESRLDQDDAVCDVKASDERTAEPQPAVAREPHDDQRLAAAVADNEILTQIIADAPPEAVGASLSDKTVGDQREVTSISHGIKTVDDLLRHIEADMTRFEVAASEATVWESPSGEGKVPLFRVWVRLKPRAGPGVRECVEAMIDAAASRLARPAVKPRKRRAGDLWQVLPIADPHFGRYAWRETAKHDYDLRIAADRVRGWATELLEIGDEYGPGRRTIAFLGDLFHYDTPAGTTTSGTPLDRDGRLQKMIQVGCDVLLEVIERSAESAATDIVIVPGNHDTTLTWAFQRIALERFRNDGRVGVSNRYTFRQYLHHGKTLLGFTHGNKAKKDLPQLMSLESPTEWGRCPYREWHTAHLHHSAAKAGKVIAEDGIATIHGVVVRTAPAACGNDDWHYENGFVGARRSMETFLYAKEGGLAAMHVAGR